MKVEEGITKFEQEFRNGPLHGIKLMEKNFIFEEISIYKNYDTHHQNLY